MHVVTIDYELNDRIINSQYSKVYLVNIQCQMIFVGKANKMEKIPTDSAEYILLECKLPKSNFRSAITK